jgi:hypothetical protein
MKVGKFNLNEYLNRLDEEAEKNTEKGFITNSIKDGILLPDDTKKNFDWLKSEYQKGKTEVKIEIKGEGSSFKPGYELQTDLKSIKDFKPGMYGQVKTSNAETSPPKDPKNKKEETPAEDKEPKGDNEATDDTTKKADKAPKAQQMKLDVSKKKEDDK